ncbi:xylose isomerase [Luteolibacter arcticus]|uniref:Xylose isomerase n=1 Tax=Luteolibacter arcticus TaxID=1581411 RepID=A0ABT3GKA4_9BACT|nr:xylose isomerase [Luteolibacter arcticus]MCW1923915.1 xylose isomerase [Luteolibacter arcticus]
MAPARLKHFASLWTLLHYPNGSESEEWSLDRKLGTIKEAGFDGFQWFAQPEFAEASSRHGLAFLGGCDANAANHVQRLEDFAPLKPERINIQLGDHSMEPAEAAALWIRMNDVADDLGLILDLETHRGTCTETPEKTWRIAEIYEQKRSMPIRLTFDFSHFATVKHLVPPYAERLLERPDLLQASRQIHLRPFNGHHCEIPATNPDGGMTEWAKHWFDLLEAAFHCWLQEEANQGVTLWACPEFGAMSSGYWLPSFPDPWEDATFVKQESDRLWQSMIS